MTAGEVIDLLQLSPHPEGGWFRQTWVAEGEGRPSGTAIYFLLKSGERSHWHKVDAAEIWHHYCGAPLILSVARTARGPAEVCRLGPNLLEGERPQVIVPKDAWQSARVAGDEGWALVGCTVSPGFQFEGFELAPPDFEIPGP